MSNQENSLLYQERGAVAVISINRARQRNTLSIATLHQLIDKFSELSRDANISVIVLHGLGESFAAGADINELLALTPASAVDFSQLGARLFNAMRYAPQLIIAAIDGFCMGGGLDLALACDLRYATRAALFAHPGANIGIITGFGGTRRLPQAIGSRQAEQLNATAERINGEEAFKIGLIQELVTEESAYHYALTRADILSQHGSKMISQLKTVVRLSGERRHQHTPKLIEYYCQLIAKD